MPQKIKERGKIPPVAASKIIETMADWVLVIDHKTHTWIFSNPAIEKVLGYKAEEVIGETTLKVPIIPPASREIIKKKWEELLEKGYLSNIEIELIHKDGRKIPFSYSESIIRDEKGEVLYRLAILRDISTTRQLREELEKKLKKLESFQKIAVGRELKMLELKKKIQKLEEEIKQLKG